MKITIEIDDKEIVEGLVEAAIDLDKEMVKRLIRGLVTEAVLSLNAPTLHQLADKFIQIEHEINYRASSEREE
jgi:hypothetical protein